jgi:2-iminobutanoate/2-iminopropanoate deaminase
MPAFTPTVVADRFVFVSGRLAIDGNGLCPGDVVDQTNRCLDGVADALAPHGCTLADVVKTTVWLADPNDFAQFDTTYATRFPGTLPARSTVGAVLMVPGALVEIEAIALHRA